MFLEIFVRPLEIACCFWMWSVPCKNNGTLPEVNLIFITLKRLAGKLNYGQIHSDNFHLFCSLFYHWGLWETTVLYLRSSIGPPILGNHNPLAFCGPCLRHNILEKYFIFFDLQEFLRNYEEFPVRMCVIAGTFHYDSDCK